MTRHNLVSGLVAALLVSSLVSAVGIGVVADRATAQTASIEKNVTEGTLVVTVQGNDAPFDGGEATVNVTVRASGNATSVSRTRAPNNGTYRYAFDLTQFDANATLERANVTVAANGTSQNLGSKQMDLRWLKVSPNGGDAAFRSPRGTDDWQLEVPLEATVGVTDTADVQTDVNGATVTGRVREGPTPTLVLPRQSLADAGVLEEPDAASISAVSEPDRNGSVSGTGSVNLSLPAVAETVVRADGDEVRVRNPLLVAGQEYDVTLETVETSTGVFANRIEAGSATVRVTQPALASARTLTVRINRSGSVVVPETKEDVRATVHSANVTDGGTTVLVEGLQSPDVTALWVQNPNNSSVERFDVESSRGEDRTRLDIEGERALNATSAYRLLLVFEDGSRAIARTDVDTGRDSSDGPSGTAGTDERDGGPLEWLSSFGAVLLLPVALVVVVVVGVVLVVFAPGALRGIDPRSTSGSGRPRSGRSGDSGGSLAGGGVTDEVTLTVTATDGATGESFPGTPTVVARHRSQPSARSRGGRQTGRTGSGQLAGSRSRSGGGQNEKRTATMRDGEARFESIEPGVWTVELVTGQRTIASENVTVRSDDEHVGFTVSPHVIQIKVVDAASGEPLPGTAVELHESTGEERTERTGSDGIAQQRVSRAASATEVSVSRDGYRSWSSTIHSSLDPTQARRLKNTVELERERGSISIETAADGRPLPGVPVTVRPADESTAGRTGGRRVETGEGGTVSVSELPVGSYVVEAKPEQSTLEPASDPREVAVAPGATESVEVPVRVPYSLSPAQRRRCEELHERVEHLTDVTDRDVAIQHYFGTVIRAALESVEAVEERSALCYLYGTPPDDVVEALLDGIEDALSAVESSMKVTRNVKLFRACADYDSVEVRWSGEVELEAYLERLDDGAPAQRRELRNRLEALDEFLDERWGEVGELGPARETYERIVERVQSAEAGDERTEVAQVYVALCLVDAIENLFDHDELLKRLNTTVY